MHSTYAQHVLRRRSRPASPEQIVSLLGPLTAAAGIVWGVVQPWRLTILHPYGQGFWWLVVEPPLLVVAAGIVFALVVARPLLSDLEEHRAASR